MFTRREKILLIAGGILLVAFALFPSLLSRDYELFYLVFIVAPLGWLIATDKDRIAKQ